MNIFIHLFSKKTSIALVLSAVWLGVLLFLSGNQELSLFQLLGLSFCFGLISATIFIVNLTLEYYIPFLQPKASEDRINVRSVLFTVFVILSIAVCNYLFVLYIEGAEFSWNGFAGLVLITIVIGILPTVGVHLLEKNKKLETKIQKIKPIADHLEEYIPKRWTLKINQSDSRNINLESLLYVESQKNYLVFHFDNQNTMEIRLTMKKLAEKFSAFSFMVRCHRSFIINMEKVEQIQGNQQGYSLLLKDNAGEIPVSRSYIEEVQSWAKKE